MRNTKDDLVEQVSRLQPHQRRTRAVIASLCEKLTHQELHPWQKLRSISWESKHPALAINHRKNLGLYSQPNCLRPILFQGSSNHLKAAWQRDSGGPMRTRKLLAL